MARQAPPIHPTLDRLIRRMAFGHFGLVRTKQMGEKGQWWTSDAPETEQALTESKEARRLNYRHHDDEHWERDNRVDQWDSPMYPIVDGQTVRWGLEQGLLREEGDKIVLTETAELHGSLRREQWTSAQLDMLVAAIEHLEPVASDYDRAYGHYIVDIVVPGVQRDPKRWALPSGARESRLSRPAMELVHRLAVSENGLIRWHKGGYWWLDDDTDVGWDGRRYSAKASSVEALTKKGWIYVVGQGPDWKLPPAALSDERGRLRRRAVPQIPGRGASRLPAVSRL